MRVSGESDWFEDLEMRPFNLQFKGSLHSDQTSNGKRRRDEMQAIRRALHPQILKACNLNPLLKRIAGSGFISLRERGFTMGTGIGARRWDTDWAKVTRRDLEFVPFVVRGAQRTLTCALDLRIFWREEYRGGILRQGSDGFDIDSRIKGIIDSLTVPPHENQLPDDTSQDPNPFLCLLENDNLVTRLSVEAYPLGLPPVPEEEEGYLEFNVDVQVYSDESDSTI